MRSDVFSQCPFAQKTAAQRMVFRYAAAWFSGRVYEMATLTIWKP